MQALFREMVGGARRPPAAAAIVVVVDPIYGNMRCIYPLPIGFGYFLQHFAPDKIPVDLMTNSIGRWNHNGAIPEFFQGNTKGTRHKCHLCC
jgi:hypothetical protein